MRGTDSLTAKQTAFLARLLTAKRIKDAAQDTGVPESTCYRWLAAPAFQDALRAAKAEHLTLSMMTLAHASQSAILTLVELLTDASASVRVDAARVLVHACLKMADAHLEERLSELEAQHARQQLIQEQSSWEPHGLNGRG